MAAITQPCGALAIFTPDELVYPPGAPGKELVLGDLVAMDRSGERTVPGVLQDKTVIVSEVKSLLAAVESPKPDLRLFLSYSHKDEKYVDELRKALKIMERNGLTGPRYDRQLSAGEKWEARILQELSEADIIVCQTSLDFLASDFCVLTELDTAIRRHEAGEGQLAAVQVLRAAEAKKARRLDGGGSVRRQQGNPIRAAVASCKSE